MLFATKKISIRADICPYCGDQPYTDVMLLYSLAGFSFLLGLQILQIPSVPLSEKKYLYFLLLISSIFFVACVLFFKNPFIVDSNSVSLFSLVGIFFMVWAIIHLSYVIFRKKTKIKKLR